MALQNAPGLVPTTDGGQPYLRKSIKFFRIYGGLFLFSIVVSAIVRPLLIHYAGFLDLLIGLPFIPLFVMAPMGVFYSWKSSSRNEGSPKLRLRYLIGHLFFCVLIVFAVAIFVSDISQLF